MYICLSTFFLARKVELLKFSFNQGIAIALIAVSNSFVATLAVSRVDTMWIPCGYHVDRVMWIPCG